MTINFILNAALLLLLATSMIFVYRAAKQFSLQRLHKDRRGVSYSLTMVMTLPFYVAMVLGGIELTWLFRSSIHFQRATMMAGRSISVCYQQEFEKHEQDEAEMKKAIEQIGELAAAAVMISTGSGLEEHLITQSTEKRIFVERLLQHLKATTSFTPNEDTQRRAGYAAGATNIEFQLLPSKSNGSKPGRRDRAIVKVTYAHAFCSQAVGRVFGQLSSDGNSFYVRKLEKQIEIPLEIARSKDGTMGIK